MKENKYDDNIFFQKYSQMSRSQKGLAGAGEWETLKKMLPDFKGKRVLDLGCGYGWHCIYAMENGASSVVGVDISHKMLEVAKGKTHFPQIEYECCAIEDVDFPEESFDVILSSLAFHYVADYENLIKIDLTLLPLEELGNYLNDDKLIKIILDKDGRIQQAVVPTDMDYHIRKPSAREYDDCCNEFWNTTTYVVKGLCRKEILFAIDHFNQIVRHELLRMISWKVGIETGFKLSVGKNYKFIERYISEDLWEKLLSTYRMDSYENIWEALFLCHQLFRAVSGEVAERLHYAYPEYDRNITKYTRDMYKKYTGKTGCLDSTYAADIEERREQ